MRRSIIAGTMTMLEEAEITRLVQGCDTTFGPLAAVILESFLRGETKYLVGECPDLRMWLNDQVRGEESMRGVVYHQ